MGPWRHVRSGEALEAWLRRVLGIPELQVEVAALAPGLLGLRARGLRLAAPLHRGGRPTEILAVDELTLRPSLSPLGVHVVARLYGGQVDAHVGLLGHHHRLMMRIQGVRLEQSPLAATTDLSVDGSVTMAAELVVQGRDPATVGGLLALRLDGVFARGGTVAGRPLPPADLGTLALSLRASRGTLTIESAASRGPDIESVLGGEVVLARRLASSAMRLLLRLRPTPALVAREPAAAEALATAVPADVEGYHAFVIGPSLAGATLRPAIGEAASG